MDKEHGQHLRVGHDAQKLRMIAQFHEVIGRGGGGTGQPERRIGEKVDDLIPHLSRKGFQDAGFIQHHRREMRSGELVQLLIVGDVHTGLDVIGGFAEGDGHSEFHALAHGLRGNG